MNKNLAILGFAPTWQHAPFDDLSYDIWGTNHLYLEMEGDERITAWFELHHPDDFIARATERLRWFREPHDFPVFVHDQDVADEFGYDPFPRRDIERHFRRGEYHCGTFDWLLSYAIMLGQYERIEFHGIHGMMDGEPPSARPCLEYSAGVAEASGIEVHVPNECDALTNVEQRGGQYAFSRPVDGLGATYLRGGIHWKKAPEIGIGCVVGTEGPMKYLGFPAFGEDYLNSAEE